MPFIVSVVAAPNCMVLLPRVKLPAIVPLLTTLQDTTGMVISPDAFRVQLLQGV